MKQNKKASVTLYIAFFSTLTIMLVMAALLAPLGAQFTSELYEESEQIMLDANATLADINNATVRANLQNSFDEALDATEFNIDVLTDIYQYGWIIVAIISALVLFILSRQLVETRAGGSGFL